ncbi:DUF998 domain-containing protein [Thermodesulfobacteriota bacterium]
MYKKNKLFGYLSIFGSIIFIAIILFLHLVQSQYDFMNQYMSELAMGKYGKLMIIAFCCFALSVFSVSEIFRIHGSLGILNFLFMIASVCLIGAGVINLEYNATIHIVFVMIASVLIILGMILSPYFIFEYRDIIHRAVSLSLGIIAILISILDQYCIPEGIGQRVTACCILIWLIWVGIRELQFNHESHTKANLVDAKNHSAD